MCGETGKRVRGAFHTFVICFGFCDGPYPARLVAEGLCIMFVSIRSTNLVSIVNG